MANPPNHRRYHDLDALRAIAMLLGILLHGIMSFMALPSDVQPIQDVDQNPFVYGAIMKSIHGFRMPLFFLVSGFFTTMMWQKRGPGGLIQHRAVRIGVPLFIGTFTIIPMIWWVMITGATNLWMAVDQGNETYVQRYVDAGGNLERPLSGQIPGAGMMPLHIAVAKPNSTMAEILVDGGAEVDSRTLQTVGEMPSGSTPLHFAASAANLEMSAWLLESGADVNAINAEKLTPLDVANGDEVREALASAGGVFGKQLPVAQVDASLERLKPTRGPDHDYLTDWIKKQPTLVQLGCLFAFFPVFMHLWFLYYLLMLVAGFVVVAGLGRMLKLRGPPSWLMRRPVAWFWLIPITFAVQLCMLQTFGPDTAIGLLPWPPTLLYYGLFFGFGAACYGRPELEERLGANWKTCLILALAILPVGIYSINHRGENFLLYHSAAALISACYVWLMCFGLIGLFQRFFHSESSRVRYVSDAAYWMYLMHIPLVMYLQSSMADWPLPSYAKVVMICGVTTIILLLSYAIFVRYTPIGTLLNGKKTRRPKLVPASETVLGGSDSQPLEPQLASDVVETP